MGRQEPHEIPNYSGAEWRTNMNIIEEAINQLFEKLRRHLEILDQKINTLPCDNYLWGNWREDEKILSFEEGALETTEYTNQEKLLDTKDTNAPTNRWISVHDRLPRCDESVIVTDGELVHEAHLSVCHKWWRRAGISWLRIDATHWMPMPEPPEMEKKEK